MFDFGTALSSKRALNDAGPHRFAPLPPSADKGFILAQLRGPGGPHVGAGEDTGTVDLVSAHLDSSRESVRQAQVEKLLRVLSARDRPVILAGGFNADRATRPRHCGAWFADVDKVGF